MKLKYKILKAIDVSGFSFLDPIVRLCYGEEPQEQFRRIIKTSVIPVLAFIAFILVWDFVAPRHTTKSGEVPTPAVVWDAAKGVWTFHEREIEKTEAYVLPQVEVDQALTKVDARISKLENTLIPQANEKIATIATEESEWRKSIVGALQSEYEQLDKTFDEAKKKRRELIKKLSEDSGSEADRLALIEALKENEISTESEREELKILETEIKELNNRRYAPMYWVSREAEKLQEERQYLVKLSDILTNNRNVKIEEMKSDLDALNSSYLAGNESNDYGAARKIVRLEGRIESTETSSFSSAKTFPYQIKRSLLCVFTGFLIASGIAIPVGILCGLNRIFMAAMTPFIAIFKPVSPIVWLPIALIVIGGFIPDPDAFQSTMNQIPLLGEFEINPAFLASAITVALCSLWPTLVNTALGVASIDKDHINVARVLKLSWWDRLVKIVIPSALPLIFAGLRISLGVGWMVLIAAELLSSSEGIGKFVWDMFSNGSSDSFAQMFVVVFVVGVIGFLLDRIMIVLQRMVSFDGAPTAL